MIELICVVLAVLVPTALVIGFNAGVHLMRQMNREFNEDMNVRMGYDNTYQIR